MCHAVCIRLSPAERKAAPKLTGIMVPIYACIALFALAAIALTSAPRLGDAIASANHAAPSAMAE
jgi:hypothetical protein